MILEFNTNTVFVKRGRDACLGAIYSKKLFSYQILGTRKIFIFILTYFLYSWTQKVKKLFCRFSIMGNILHAWNVQHVLNDVKTLYCQLQLDKDEIENTQLNLCNSTENTNLALNAFDIWLMFFYVISNEKV